MIIHPGFAGIDISKAHLDVFDGRLGKPERFENTEVAARKLARRFKKQKSFVLFEATGRYDQVLREALTGQGLAFARVNPARARDFARATGQLAKTDAIDAQMLAAMAQTLSPESFVPASPERQKLAGLLLRRDQLVSMRADEKTRLEALSDAATAKAINRHIAFLGKDITEIEKQIAALEASDNDLTRDSRLLRTIPSVGPVGSTVLMALMPELGRCSPREIAALAGLAPFNADTGKTHGKRKIRGGRRRVRNALYMAAITAIRGKSKFAEFYEKLVAKGRAAKSALIAVARKILVTANAMIRDNKPYAAR